MVSNANSHNANSHNVDSHNVDQNVDQNVDLRAAVAIGASAGGIEALSRLAAGLSRSCGTHDW